MTYILGIRENLRPFLNSSCRCSFRLSGGSLIHGNARPLKSRPRSERYRCLKT